MNKEEQLCDMSFNEALKILRIEEYAQRILSSNSRGELFHITQYIDIARCTQDNGAFKIWFESIVKWAEENWERPESVFQHILKLLVHYLKDQS